MKKYLILSVLIVTIFTVSCGGLAMGRKFNTAYVQEIVIGKTTKADVRRGLGEPNNISFTARTGLGLNQEKLGGASETWRYSYAKGPGSFRAMGSLFGGPPITMQQEALIITFEKDIVTNFNFNKNQ